MNEEPKRPKGFAALKLRDPERLKNIATRGGRSAHEMGVAHEFTSEEAREAGRKGGAVTHANKRAAKARAADATATLYNGDERPRD